MVEFTNEFRVRAVPQVFNVYRVGFDKHYLAQSKFDYKSASQVSRRLSDEMRTPVASLGSQVITRTDVQLPPSVVLTMKIEGLPTDVEIELTREGEIRAGAVNFSDAAKKYLNREVDVILHNAGFRQDARGFYEERSKNVGGFYATYEGIHVSTRVNDGQFSLVIDPVTHVRAKLDLLHMLKHELESRGIDHWKKAVDVAAEINKLFRSRAYNLRSTYVEPQRDEYRHNDYRLVGFKFETGIDDIKGPRSPAEFHRKFGREFSPDQPVVEVVAQDGRTVNQIPELLEELPSPKTLRRFGASGKVHDRALKNANTRYYMTSELLKPLVAVNMIDQRPIEVEVEAFGPVRLTVKGGYIDLKSNSDFQTIFKKQKLLKAPMISSIVVFSTEEDAPDARKLTGELLEAFTDFNLVPPKVVERLDLPSSPVDFQARASKEIAAIKPTMADLVLVVSGFEDVDMEGVTYASMKKDSLERLFPSQFVNTDSIKIALEDDNLRKGIVNPLFLQIVAKCGGQPYGLQPGFVPTGTIFVGIDKYHHPFKTDASTIVSVTIFDSDGSYIGGNSDILTFSERNVSHILKTLLRDSYSAYKSIKKDDASTILFMIDSGVGTLDEEFRQYAESCSELASNAGANYALVSGNKASHLRLYTGNPADFALTAERVSPFTAATKMPHENQLLVVSTEPIISREHSKEYGTPRTVLYTILARTGTEPLEDTKRMVAKSVTWLCRHAWVSPASTREPAPIFFANKLSKMVALTGIRVTSDRTTAPLFL